MSSGSHLSKDLHDLVKSIGETRSKQEEDKIIVSEVASLQLKIKEKKLSARKIKENIIRALYIEMLGHDASFCHIEAINLSQNKSLSLKRIGYLATSLFLNEDSEMLILIVSTIQRDLSSKEPQEILTALNAITYLTCGYIVNAVSDPVQKLLNHTNELVKKKAIIALERIYKHAPQLVPDYLDKLRRSLWDKDTSVMGASLPWFLKIAKENSTSVKDLTSSFVVILKQIIDHKYNRDYDYHRMPAPWLQIKILQILSCLGHNDLKTSEQIYEVLYQALKRADDTAMNIGYAVTYQCIITIASIYPSSNLLESAATSVTRFITSENNNLKVLGIKALIKLVNINAKYALEHQLIVVDCLESLDETLKRETLQLLMKMTNSSNIEAISEKLLHYLKTESDPLFKKDLVAKKLQLCERFAPSQEWFFKTMNQIFEFGAEYISQTNLTSLITLIEDNFRADPENFPEPMLENYKTLAKSKKLPDVMIKLIAWVFGEVASDLYSQNPDALEEIAELLINNLDGYYESSATKGYILSALAKISYHISSSKIRNIFQKYRNSKSILLSEESLEYEMLPRKVMGLKGNTQITVDSSLSFLNSFTSKAISAGSKKYSRPAQSHILSMIDIPKESQIKFEPYSASSLNEKVKVSQNEHGSGLIVKGKSKWTEVGYAGEEKAKPQPTEIKTAISSTAQSLSSKDFVTKMGTSNISTTAMNYKSFENPKAQNHEPSPVFTPKEDPALANKQKLASNLFKGLGGSGNMFEGISMKKTSEKKASPPVVVNQVQPKAPINVVQKAKETDLLDLFDMDDNPPIQNPQPIHKPEVSANSLLQGLKTKTQAKPPQQQPQPSNPFSPLALTIEDYEKYWESWSDELIHNFNNCISVEDQFRNFISKLNLRIIEIIDNEIVVGGKYSDSTVVLLYGVYEPNGNLELRVKAQKDSVKQILMNKCKEVLGK